MEIATNLERFSTAAEVVICAASLASPSLLLNRIAPGAIVCDAGYPKNLSASAQMPGARVFFGGLGQVTGGMRFAPDFRGVLNRHPFPDVVHGCLLEAMALALEGRFEPFSQGRGFITPEKVDEIRTIAARHGIYLAPLYNGAGPLEDGLDCPDGPRAECCRMNELNLSACKSTRQTARTRGKQGAHHPAFRGVCESQSTSGAQRRGTRSSGRKRGKQNAARRNRQKDVIRALKGKDAWRAERADALCARQRDTLCRST